MMARTMSLPLTFKCTCRTPTWSLRRKQEERARHVGPQPREDVIRSVVEDMAGPGEHGHVRAHGWHLGMHDEQVPQEIRPSVWIIPHSDIGNIKIEDVGKRSANTNVSKRYRGVLRELNGHSFLCC
jgi:hypothetical protein